MHALPFIVILEVVVGEGGHETGGRRHEKDVRYCPSVLATRCAKLSRRIHVESYSLIIGRHTFQTVQNIAGVADVPNLDFGIATGASQQELL